MSDTIQKKSFAARLLDKRTPRALSLPAALILFILMLFNIRTFVLDTSSAAVTVASSIYSVWIAAIFALMLYTGRTAFYRRIFFIATALLFFPAFMHDLILERGFVALSESNIVNNETPFCHIVIPITLIPAALSRTVIFPARLSGHYASIYGILVLWLIASITLGRGWCSWVCFYGGWDEGFSKIKKRRIINTDNLPPAVRYFGFSMLMFVVLAGLVTLGSVYCEWLCPFKLVTEFSAITSIRTYIATIIFIIVFFGLVVTLPILTKKRTQCAMFCPFGAFQSFTNKFNVYKIAIDHSKCTKCMACVRACPTLSLIKDDIASENPGAGITCTKCMECIGVCPNGAITLEYSAKAPEGLFKWFRGTLASLAGRNNPVSRFTAKTISVFKDLLKPEALFPFTAFTFGMIISSKFAIHSISLVLSQIPIIAGIPGGM